jgi:hypothetical protein
LPIIPKQRYDLKEEKAMIEIKKILFPLDLTENSSKILPYVLSLSEKYNSLIYLFHVVQDLTGSYRILIDGGSSMYPILLWISSKKKPMRRL